MHTRFQAVWSDLSPQLQQALAPYLEQDEFRAGQCHKNSVTM